MTTSKIVPQPSFTNQIRESGLFPTIGRELSLTLAEAARTLRAIAAFLFGPRQETIADGNDRLYRTVTILSVVGSLFLASVSFVGSFTAARAYAIRHGIAPSVAAWIPVSVDGFILLAILVVFGASLVAAPVGWVRFLILVFTIISVIFNVAHITEAATPTLENVLLASVFPMVIFLASEITSQQITAYIKRRTALKNNDQLLAAISARQAELASLDRKLASRLAKLDRPIGQPDLKAGRSDGQSISQPGSKAGRSDNHKVDRSTGQDRQANIDHRRQKLAGLLATNPGLTNQQLASQLAVSLSTVKSDKAALNGQLASLGEAK